MSIRCIIILTLLIAFGLRAEVVNSFKIVGNVNIEDEVLISQLDFAIGDEVDDRKLTQMIRKLYISGLFSDISMSLDKGVLLIKIKENPIINEVVIEDNISIKNSKIDEVISLKSNGIFSKEKLDEDILEVIKLYKENGIVAVTVKPYEIKRKDNKIDLIYKIEEGKKAKIRSIEFINNESFSAAVLKSSILSKEYAFYNFITDNHYYVSERVDLDGKLLRDFYLSRGFMDFKIDSVATEFDGENVYITFMLSEGNKYTVKDIEIMSSIDGLDVNSLAGLVKIASGETFNLNKIQASVEAVTLSLNENGYYVANVIPDYKIEGDEVTISYQIEEGQKIHIDRINIKGNERTLDSVIRREIDIYEGGMLNTMLINRSKRNVARLGFFNNVDFQTILKGDKADVDILVEERNTGMANIGGGLSSNLGIVGNFSISESNLLGTGNKLLLSLEKSSSNLSSSISFTKPYILNSPLSSGVDLFIDIADHKHGAPYDSFVHGITLRTGRNLTNDLKGTLKYSYKRSKIDDIDDNASPLIKDQEGITHTSLIGYSLAYDKLNKVTAPTDGYLLRSGQDFAGFGGGLQYIRSEASAIRFFQFHEDIVFQLSARTGYIDSYGGQEVRIGQRFFMGSNDLRGFRNSGIGPRDIKTGDSLGGNFRVLSTLQADFPIIDFLSKVGVNGSLFLDAGTLTGLDSITDNVVDTGNIRASLGFGFSWASPFGLLRVDFGFPVMKDEYDRTQTLSFKIGSSL